MNRERNRGIDPGTPSHTHAAPSDESEHTPATACRLLVADDDSISRFLMVRVLKKNLPQLGIHQACDGNETLQLWRQHRPLIVLTDIQMPGIHGLDMVAAIRREEADHPAQTAPSGIILVSGSCCSDIRDDLREHGITRILEKPVEPELLISVVRSCLPGSSL